MVKKMFLKNNLNKCRFCKLDIIQEESLHHVCSTGEIIDFYFDTDEPNSVIVYDGKNSFSMPISFLRMIMKSHQPRGNTYNTTEEGTEPYRGKRPNDKEVRE